MIERWHRRLKDAFRAAVDDFSWVDCLPLIMPSLHIAQRDDGQPSPAEVVYGSSLTLPADLITPSSERIEYNILDYSHRLKAHMQNVRPIVTRHNTALNKTYHRDPTLKTGKKIFLRKMNKTGLQDNYIEPFDVIARSEKYFTIRFTNGKIDNVTTEQVKPCFSQADTLPRPTIEEEHVVNPPAPPVPPAPQLPPAPPAPPTPPAAPAPRADPLRLSV